MATPTSADSEPMPGTFPRSTQRRKTSALHRKIHGFRDPVARLVIERLLSCFYGICFILVTGTLGYVCIEGWSVADGFFMTIITISTVGYGETQSLTADGRLFTSLLIVLSVIGMACFTACLTTTFISRELSETLVTGRIKKMINKLSGHTVIVGAGIMAETIILRLVDGGSDVVLIEENPTKVDDFRRRFPEIQVLQSHPRNELVLSDANVMKAGSVVVGLDSDFDNLLIAISIKELNPKVYVVARADDTKVASRMLKIGVDQVICPNQLSGEIVVDAISERRQHKADCLAV